jgi:hypothetical protein
MKNFLRPVFNFLDELFNRVFNFLEWLVTDHNGKPSTSRLLLWIWSGFCISWIQMEVCETGVISRNAVYLVVISLIGPSISIILKGAKASYFASIIKAIFSSGNGAPATTQVKTFLQPKPGENDGA